MDTYVEETELSVNSYEEEVERCDGGATWQKGEENEGGDQASQETKMSGSGAVSYTHLTLPTNREV